MAQSYNIFLFYQRIFDLSFMIFIMLLLSEFLRNNSFKLFWHFNNIFIHNHFFSEIIYTTILQRAIRSDSSLINTWLSQISIILNLEYPLGNVISRSSRSDNLNSFWFPFHSSFLKIEDRIRYSFWALNFPLKPCFCASFSNFSFPHIFLL